MEFIFPKPNTYLLTYLRLIMSLKWVSRRSRRSSLLRFWMSLDWSSWSFPYPLITYPSWEFSFHGDLQHFVDQFFLPFACTWNPFQLTHCVNLSVIVGPWTFNHGANLLWAQWLKSKKRVLPFVVSRPRYLSILALCKAHILIVSCNCCLSTWNFFLSIRYLDVFHAR